MKDPIQIIIAKMKNGFHLNLIFKLLFFLEFAALANGRDIASLSPFSPPAPSPHFSSLSSPPHAMQVVVIYKRSHIQKELVLAIVLSLVTITLIILSASFTWIFCLSNRTNSKHNQGSDSSGEVTFGPNSSKFSSFKATGRKNALAVIEFSLLELATNNFNEGNIIGQGGFGYVYKACFGDGVFAAVKKLDGSSQYCESEFENEVDLLGKIHHPNIITLLGYCVHEDMRFLVYELMQNGSLEGQLYGPSNGSALTWHMRMKIALDVARGLEHLHENYSPTVIHRDLKSSNILLDSEFKSKISDFGLAVSKCNQTNCEIKLSGTLGYVAPEYLLDGKLTEKSDVYAFGVVLLELLTGRKPVEKVSLSQCQTIVSWAMPQLTDRSKLPTLVDPAIKNTMDLKHLYQVAAVAVLCVQPEPCYRPLITDVLHSLVPLVPLELGGTLRISDYGKANINLQHKL